MNRFGSPARSNPAAPVPVSADPPFARRLARQDPLRSEGSNFSPMRPVHGSGTAGGSP
jgi:hypothetical protein